MSSHPVAGTSTIGEQPLQGELLVKFGSDISWWPLGSPGLVVGPGTGRSGSSVDALVGMTVEVLALVALVTGNPLGG